MAIAAVLTVGACTQKIGPEPAPVADSSELFNLEVSVPLVKTKATTGNDATVNQYQVFVFRDNGTLEAGSYGTDASQTVKVTRGAKTVAVLTNSAKISQTVTFETLKDYVLQLSENSTSSVQMFGTQTINLTGNADVTVEVTRLLSKISIGTIENAIELDQYKDLTLTVKGIYLINVVGERKIDNAYASTAWYNKMKLYNTECPALLYDSMSQTIANGSSYSANRFFYCYPNDSADSTADTWSPRKTRLVVEVTLGTETWYYPVTINEVVANTHYQITGLKITRIGAKTPDETIDIDAATFTITVKDWTLSPIDTVTI